MVRYLAAVALVFLAGCAALVPQASPLPDIHSGMTSGEVQDSLRGAFPPFVPELVILTPDGRMIQDLTQRRIGGPTVLIHVVERGGVVESAAYAGY